MVTWQFAFLSCFVDLWPPGCGRVDCCRSNLARSLRVLLPVVKYLIMDKTSPAAISMSSPVPDEVVFDASALPPEDVGSDNTGSGQESR